MKNPFAWLFRSMLERFRRTRQVPIGPSLSPEQFRELLIEALDDPAIARLAARRLLLPTFPIAGASDDPVTTTNGGTAGYLPYFTSSSNIENSVVFEDAATGKVGVGTDVPGARLEAADPSVLAGENLTNGDLTGGTSWLATGDMALVSNAATYTHSAGVGTLKQLSGSFALAAKPYRLYLFTYTITAKSGTPPSASISTAFAAEARPLNTKDNGTHSVMLHAAASPGDFVISVTSSAAGSFTIDDLSLKEITGGDIIADGLFTGGGPTGIKVDNAGNVGIGESSPDYKLDVNGAFGFTPGSSVTPVDNGDVIFELTNNTTLTIKAKGSDGTVRSGTITLA